MDGNNERQLPLPIDLNSFETLPALVPDEYRDKITDHFPKVCSTCKERNLTEDVHIMMCGKCDISYCRHAASTVDPQYCNECCRDIEMTENIILKKSEHYNEEKDKVHTKTSKARQIQFSGLDWLFFNRKISELTDTELLLSIEYHQAIYQSMMYEREKRRVDHFHRNAGKKIKVSKNDGNAVTSETSTTVKKTRTVRAKKDPMAAFAARMQALIDGGLTQEQILAAMMKGAKK